MLAYALAARHWRTEKRDRVAHERRIGDRREQHAHAERVEFIRATARVETARVQIDGARESTAYADALAQALTARAALPGYDPAAITGTGLSQLSASSHKEL